MYAYCTTFKVTTRYTPFQLIYGLYPLMPMEYLIPTSNSHFNQKKIPTRILTSRMVELEHLDETHHAQS